MTEEDAIDIGVTVIAARNLTNMDLPFFGKNDAFATVKVGNQTKKTVVIPNAGKAATWNETFHFVLRPRDDIEVQVLDEDTLKNDLIGSIKISSSSIFEEGSLEGWYSIFRGEKARGEVNIRIHYIPRPL